MRIRIRWLLQRLHSPHYLLLFLFRVNVDYLPRVEVLFGCFLSTQQTEVHCLDIIECDRLQLLCDYLRLTIFLLHDSWTLR